MSGQVFKRGVRRAGHVSRLPAFKEARGHLPVGSDAMSPVLLLISIVCGAAALGPAAPLLWLGVQRSRKSLSWESPSDCVRAARSGVLAPVQKAACKANLALMPVLSSASRRVADACQQVFRTHRWNCSSVEKAPNFGQDLLRGTREQAYVSALSSAALAVGVARACAEGRIRSCGCGRPSPREPPPDDFQWGGCADDAGAGVRAAKALCSEPFDRRKFAGDVAIRMHRHNSRAGWRAVRASQRVQCKCHGVSGSCEVKTCWHALPPLLEVARKLKLRHRDAEEVRPVMVGRGTKLLPATNARFNKDDLVYREQSPDYCVYDPKTGSEGTKGRQCNSTATDSFGCEAMCCSRGFLTTWVETEERCNCKFQRCCYVTCDVCKRRTNLNLCL